jgi:hypothetical protein
MSEDHDSRGGQGRCEINVENRTLCRWMSLYNLSITVVGLLINDDVQISSAILL